MTFNIDTEPTTDQTTDPFETEGATWWRVPCVVTDHLVVSGDLHHDAVRAVAQLETWTDAGVTGIIDCRGEWSDKRMVHAAEPDIVYYEHGTHDAGGTQDSEWYRAGYDYYKHALRMDPEGKVMVHCHMGINRAPSLAFYILIREGYAPAEALTLIRDARPIAACFYAESAWDTYADDKNLSDGERIEGEVAIMMFFDERKIDLRRVIHEVRVIESS
jgi:dual specificity phosphatase 3